MISESVEQASGFLLPRDTYSFRREDFVSDRIRLWIFPFFAKREEALEEFS
jgi:hypothetical protein